ncbi:Genetic interactor of prohibitins 3, mitochondrial [Cytospora mali]|uniref:Genetic interactor of prohibitins 3, mitochondrial n=1 Tax=Cytospora mali TaxID=578113 RepID=A0A194VSF3_CYTMA|nr:Genetic interactor of prohibitins 3, mitochondrial [Valsa mali]
MKPGRKQISCSRLLRNVLNIDHGSSVASNLPLYLCPAAARACSSVSRPSRYANALAPNHRILSIRQTRTLHAEAAEPTETTETTVAAEAAEAAEAVEAAQPAEIAEPIEITETSGIIGIAETTEQAVAQEFVSVQPTPTRKLPVQCAGCGALSQTAVPDEPGHFDLDRKAVRLYLGLLKEEPRRRTDSDVLQDALRNRGDILEGMGINPEAFLPERPTDGEPQEPDVPLCDRCHNLIHHHIGNPIYHPTIEAIRETIEESPYKYNHVYHVLDAADFPMSLLPRVHQLLDLMPLRTKNRRSMSGKFFKGKKTEMSFIITRSDLLAPKKEQVDRMMATLVEILRHALPRDSRHVRLGNVRCVSAKRSWWTSELKEDIWRRGGAGWMVGKVNVGKSQLFNAVFPKGRMDWRESKHDISVAVQPQDQRTPTKPTVSGVDGPRDLAEAVLPEIDGLDEDSLLPPPQKETNYPQMPVVSALPGTTASPIRVPFGGGKGELIDLPGLARSDLESYVREEHRQSLIMKARMAPEQQVIKPGQSLVIGGLIRITPQTPDLIFLAYAFTPINPHLTATDKATEIQNQTTGINIENIAIPGIGKTIKHAGSFPLRWDVTKRRAGPITRKDAVGIKVDRLPYRVLSLDLLIEGCGWVEITAQVRTKHLFATAAAASKPKPSRKSNAYGEEILQELDLSEPEPERNNARDSWNEEAEPNWPVVDVYSPEGRFVGCRPPLNAWLYNKVRKTPETSKKRPRKSMTGAKQRGKGMRRG